MKNNYINPRVTERAKTIKSDFNRVHSNKYEYPNLEYLGARHKITVTCKIHGNFMITPNSHLSGQGCRQCGFNRTSSSHQYSKESFIKLAEKVHGKGRYNYSYVQYLRSDLKVRIKCPTCNYIFEQSPNHHLQGKGCSKCGGVYKYSTEEYIQKVKGIFGVNKFDYSQTVYKTAHTKVKIGCNTCNTFFFKKAYQHLQGLGCPVCSSQTVGGFNHYAPAILYYLRVSDKAYKIGITNRSVEKRFNPKDLSKIKVIQTWEYAMGSEAYSQEQSIINEFGYARYDGVSLLQDGNTELFNYDILGLDT